MSISMFSASVPVLQRALGNLQAWFEKAEAHAAAKKYDPQVLLAARLAPDMLPFTKQVQIACDSAKFGVARLSGVEAPKFDDTEASFADLRQRIAKTLDYIRSVPAARIDGTEDNAGAILTPDSLERAHAKDLLARAMLENNDGYSFFAALDRLIVTGPTRTNVNDFRAIYLPA